LKVREVILTLSFRSLASVHATSSFPLCSIKSFSQGSSSARTLASSERYFSVSTAYQSMTELTKAKKIQVTKNPL